MLVIIMLSLYFGLFICFILYMNKLSKIKRSLFTKREPKIETEQNRKKRNVKPK